MHGRAIGTREIEVAQVSGTTCECGDVLAGQLEVDAAQARTGGHLELTGEDVTECTGGARDLGELDLERAYRSTVDPRLNYEQSLEIAMAIVRKHAQLKRPVGV